MVNCRDQLNEILSFLKREREKYNIELETCLSGSLYHSSNKRQQEFIWKDNGKRRGINKRPDIIRQLARKEFLRRLINELDANINAIQYAINRYRNINPQEIISLMNKTYRRLPPEMFLRQAEPLFTTEDADLKARLERHQAWAEQPYEKNDYPFGEYSQYTTRGLHVRSSREMIIAELLYKYEAPFRYDQVIHVGRYKLSPDFTFEMANGEELYMEYFGMMNKPEYVAKFQEKRRKYEQAGIYEWDNMIYAFSNGPKVNAAEIEAIIKTRILPRL